MTKNKDRKKIYQKDNPIIHNKDFQKINNIEKKNHHTEYYFFQTVSN